MHKRTLKTRFDARTAAKIRSRDGGCIFCKAMYVMPPERPFIFDIMHIVNRSQGGLGIEQNGVIGCRYHHTMLDNGNKGKRQEMLAYIREYMQGLYPGWDEKDLVFKKG